VISVVGGGRNNTGSATTTSLSINYSSHSSNTIVAVCALGNTAASISSITDNGSYWVLRYAMNNGTAVRSEIWSTPAGGSVASTSFTINMSGGTPASCALEEYAGVLALGNTSSAQGNSGVWSVGLTTQDANNYVVAGIGANSYYGYSNPTGTIRQAGVLTGNPGNDYVEMDLFDNTAATASGVTNGVVTAPAPWTAVALELRSAGTTTGLMPVISAVAASGITGSSATITWTTNQASSSQVEYGTTTAYGSLSTENTTLTTSHSVNLTGLTPGTTYDYAVISADATGAATSTNFSFSTPVTAPAISAVSASGITSTSATITWTTDQPSSSQVAFGTTTGYGSLSTPSSAGVTLHSVTLTGLAPGTPYDYAAISADSAGSTTSSNFSFSTPASIPTISGVTAVGITGTSATITWTTDQPSSSQVEYGMTTAYGSLSALSSAPVTSHTVTLTGLTLGATYNYAALSKNAGGGAATSSNFTFMVPAAAPPSGPAPQVQNLSFWGVTGSGITISWYTDQLSSTSVQYGTTPALGQVSPIQTNLSQNHGLTLTGLSDATTYYFRAQSTNASNVTGYSATIYSFTTLDTTAPVISSIQVTPATNNTALVTWSLSKLATSQVEYGATTSYGLWSSQTPLTQSPQSELTWVPSGTIHYRIHSSDPSGNQTTSPDYTFTEP
jgi:hypothetical protein